RSAPWRRPTASTASPCSRAAPRASSRSGSRRPPPSPAEVDVRPEEVRAVGRLGARVFADAVSHVEQVHGAIAARAFRPARVAGAPARRAHDAIAKAVYATVRGTGRGAGLATGEAVSLVTRPGQHRPMGSTRAGNVVSAVLNAAVGDRLAARHDP